MAKQYFHLTIGPVQAFVAQARRTRDFWAGSFILSYLSSAAMVAVRQQQGQIEFPVPDEQFLKALTGELKNETEMPKQGSVPNRFKAMEVTVDEGFNPKAVVDAVQLVWKELAEIVWQNDIAKVVGEDSLQREIWQRQIDNFWEISWSLTPDAQASNLLDRRKNWRSHVVADEPGVKCSLMEGYQELSAAVKPGEGVARFWQKVRAQNTNIARDIREDEHLCAIAFVKRRFVNAFTKLNVALPKVGAHAEKQVFGWKLPTSVPSIAYMAATPWLAASIVASKESSNALITIKQLEHALKSLDAPWEGKVSPYVQDACESVGYEGKRWQQVDGQFLFMPALQQAIKTTNKDIEADEKELLQAVEKHLRNLRQATNLNDPSPFYAILLMDGDLLGKQMSNAAKQKGISAGLNSFTAGVPAIVEKHSGFLVYAGGDDVLAILPQPFAIKCAQDIQKHYDACFAEINKTQGGNQITTSISAAINFAHYKTPLTHILQDSHQLLDDVAKDATGRNSLAVRVHKPGGLNAQWSTPWKYVDALNHISQQVADNLQGDLSRSFFFKLEELINDLGLTSVNHGFEKHTIEALVRAAWTHTGNKLDSLPKDMELSLFEACRINLRLLDDVSGKESFKETNQFATGALRLIQFLATENQKYLAIVKKGEDV